MKIQHTKHFLNRLRKKYRKNSQLRQKVVKQTKLLIQNEKHPSIKLHKLRGKRVNQWSFSGSQAGYRSVGSLRICTSWSYPCLSKSICPNATNAAPFPLKISIARMALSVDSLTIFSASAIP